MSLIPQGKGIRYARAWRAGGLYVYRTLNRDGHEGWCLVGSYRRILDDRFAVQIRGKHAGTVDTRGGGHDDREGAVTWLWWLPLYGAACFLLGRNYGYAKAARELRDALTEDGVFPRRGESAGDVRARVRRRERERGNG